MGQFLENAPQPNLMESMTCKALPGRMTSAKQRADACQSSDCSLGGATACLPEISESETQRQMHNEDVRHLVAP